MRKEREKISALLQRYCRRKDNFSSGYSKQASREKKKEEKEYIRDIL